ncbi:MAG: hypothetical protein K5989_03180 [Lachnospiraceae bacterium]|nr:hypothetical protein [Lachnospiraceae bacterium]
MGKAYYLTIPEFCLLCLKRDLEGLVIFDEISNYIPREEDLLQAMVALSERQFLIPRSDGGYDPNTDISLILDILVKSAGTYILRGHMSEIPMTCLYKGKDFSLAVQIDEKRMGYVRFELSKWDELVSSILEYDFMPDNIYNPGQEAFGPEDWEPTGTGPDVGGKALLSEASAYPQQADWQDFPAEKIPEIQELPASVRDYFTGACQAISPEDPSISLIMEYYSRGRGGANRRIVVFMREGRGYLVAGRDRIRHIEPYSGEGLLKELVKAAN